MFLNTGLTSPRASAMACRISGKRDCCSGFGLGPCVRWRSSASGPKPETPSFAGVEPWPVMSAPALAVHIVPRRANTKEQVDHLSATAEPSYRYICCIAALVDPDALARAESFRQTRRSTREGRAPIAGGRWVTKPILVSLCGFRPAIASSGWSLIAPVNAFNEEMKGDAQRYRSCAFDPESKVMVLGSCKRSISAPALTFVVFRHEIRRYAPVGFRCRDIASGCFAQLCQTPAGRDQWDSCRRWPEMTLHCDVRFAAVDAKLGQPEINIGFIPPIATNQTLPVLLGRPRAIRYLLRRRPCTPVMRLRWGWWMNSYLRPAVRNTYRGMRSILPRSPPALWRHPSDRHAWRRKNLSMKEWLSS